MSEYAAEIHVHEWIKLYENMIEGVRDLVPGDIVARCSSGTCNAELREPEILRRLNAVEVLIAAETICRAHE